MSTRVIAFRWDHWAIPLISVNLFGTYAAANCTAIKTATVRNTSRQATP